MGDLMTIAVQPRHIKLGLAGKQKNWQYATYELSELRNAFARIARTIPKYQNMDTAEMMTALTQAPLDTLAEAITATSSAKFKRCLLTADAGLQRLPSESEAWFCRHQSAQCGNVF